MTFGDWIAVERGPDKITRPPGRGREKRTIQYRCRCTCPTCATCGEIVRLVPAEKLRHGRSLSCGRPQSDGPCSVETCEEAAYSNGFCSLHAYRAAQYGDPAAVPTYVKHGYSGSPTYRVWAGMVSRCSYPGNGNWSQYGGADPPVAVCERWLGEVLPGRKHRTGGFAAFLTDMGERPGPDHQLHRIDNALEYGPATCQWLSRADHRRVHAETRRATHPDRMARLYPDDLPET